RHGFSNHWCKAVLRGGDDLVVGVGVRGGIERLLVADRRDDPPPPQQLRIALK
ncbi:Hypothetical predicted protein, partial [Olea europaea subsp. europaea]